MVCIHGVGEKFPAPFFLSNSIDEIQDSGYYKRVMKLNNAIKKVEKAGYTVTNEKNYLFTAEKNNRLIEWFNNKDGDIFCIRARDANDKDDPYSDYSAGVFCRNLTHAIKIS
tara:strand:- start:2488 stop:2823 length:336 start_codon:yes stop_codon:yes gene_type:complete